jgi:hypothetical protein
MSLPAALKAELSAIIAKYKEEDNTQVVTCKDLIMDACRKHNQTYKIVCTVHQLGIHPLQRDGEGVHCGRAQTRVAMIKSIGFSWAAISPNLICMEDNPHTKAIEKMTLKQCASNPKYARYREGTIVGGSLGAGHAIHGAAQLVDEVPCDISSISENGKMSKAKCFKDKGLKAFCEDGLAVEMIKWQVEDAFKEVPKIIQSALNTVTQVAEGENWPQMLNKISDEAKQHDVTNVPWQVVKKQVAKSKPPRLGDVIDLVDFVRVYGGLPTCFFVYDMQDFCLQYMPSDRVVTGSFFRWLLDLKFPHDAIPAHFVNAVVFTHAVSNLGVVDQIYARAITKGEITQFGKKLPEIREADGILKNSRSLVGAPTLPQADKLHVLSLLKQDIVWAIIDRKGREGTRSVKDIAAEFTKSFSQMVCATAELSVDSSSAAEPSDTKGESRHESGSTALLYSDDGSVLGAGKQTLLNKGVSVNSYVVKAKGAVATEQWLIKDISDDGSVAMCKVDRFGAALDEQAVTLQLEAFLQTYKVVPKPIRLLKNYPSIDAKNSTIFDDTLLKCIVASSVATLVKAVPLPSVKIIDQPCVGVYATTAYDAGQLKLTPATTSIVEKSNKAPPLKAAEATIDGVAHKFVLIPVPNSNEFVCPMWNLKIVHDLKFANMAMVSTPVYSKAPTISVDGDSPIMTCNIPCALNFKEVNENDELVLYKQKQGGDKEMKRLSVLLDSKIAKKSKQ